MENQIQKHQPKELAIGFTEQIVRGVKIRELVNTVPLKEGLAYCFKLTGLKTFPDNLETQILIDFILGAYGGLCAPELQLAFKLACSKKYEVETNHYQNFSAEYLGRVLKAYNDYRSKQLAKTQSKQLTDFTEEQIDQKQYYEEFLFMKYDALLKDKYIFTEDDERHLYRKLTEGLKINVATNSEKKSAMEDADNQIQKKYREDAAKRLDKVTARAKRICFRAWINRMAFEEIDLREEINKLL